MTRNQGGPWKNLGKAATAPRKLGHISVFGTTVLSNIVRDDGVESPMRRQLGLNKAEEILVRTLPKDATGCLHPPPSPSLVTILERLNLFSTLIKTSPNHHLRASESILDADVPHLTRLGYLQQKNLTRLGSLHLFHPSGPLDFRICFNRKSEQRGFLKKT